MEVEEALALVAQCRSSKGAKAGAITRKFLPAADLSDKTIKRFATKADLSVGQSGHVWQG
jgi:hypothetical protein